MTYFRKENLLKIDLTKPEVYAGFKQKLRDNAVFGDTSSILEYQKFFKEWFALHPEFRQTNSEQAKELDELIIEGQWMAIQAISTADVVVLLHQYLKVLFNFKKKYELPEDDLVEKIVLVENLSQHIIDQYQFPTLYKERDVLKRRLVDALLTNEEVITSAIFYHPIKEEQPTLKLWFSEYVEFVGSVMTQEQQSLFYKKNENFLRLTDIEKQHLKLLFTVYEHLRHSSATPEGIEEEVALGDDDKSLPGVLQYGEIKLYDDELINEAKQSVKTFQDLIKEPTALQARPPVDFPVATAAVLTKAKSFGPDHFTDSDAAEIAQHAQAVKGNTGAIDYAKAGKLIQQKLSIVFTDVVKAKRFNEIVESALRGLRKPQDLHIYLEQLNLTILQISQVTLMVKKWLSEHEQTSKAMTETEVLKPKFADISKTIAAVQIKRTDKPTSLVNNVGDLDKINLAANPMAFLPKLRRPKRQRKPIIDDVKFQQSMVMGPIDELRAMDLVEFRRLANNPATAVLKIKDKIDLLGEESLDKKTEGIKGFKASPLNSQYLDIGNKSITTNQSVTEVINNLQAQNVTTLTLEEFNAISDLNKQIRF
ncbi:MAG: hypothetical protein WCW27_06295 [Patescibacteria group bacterium]|jgi:hypothetical protein